MKALSTIKPYLLIVIIILIINPSNKASAATLPVKRVEIGHSSYLDKWRSPYGNG